MSTKMCKKKDDDRIDSPKFICKKCEKVAKKEDHVCKPVKIKK